MKSSFGPVVACVLGLGLAMTGATASLAQGGIGQKQGKIVVVKKAPQAAGSHSGKHSGHRHSNRGRNIAAGVAAGVVGAIILNEAARASGGDEAMASYDFGWVWRELGVADLRE